MSMEKETEMGTKKFSPRQKLTKTNIAKVPTGKPIVYKLKNTAGTTVYAGKAKRLRPQERLSDHLPGGQDPIPGAATFQVKQKRRVEQAGQEEKAIIKKEKPKYNKRT